MNIAATVAAVVLLLAGSAAAQDGGRAIQKTSISLGTATPGGGFPLYGDTFAEAMNAADPALSILPRNTKGSNENIPLLEAGHIANPCLGIDSAQMQRGGCQVNAVAMAEGGVHAVIVLR